MPGGEASGLTFRAAISATGATALRILGFALRGVKVGTESGDRAFHDVIVLKFHNFDHKVNLQLAPIVSKLNEVVVH